MASILWCHDYVGAPLHGIITYNTRNYWFRNDLTAKELVVIDLSQDDYAMVEANHVRHCEVMGLPLLYGEPRIAKKLDRYTILVHTYNPTMITGTHVATLKYTDVSNYTTSHRVEIPRTEL